MIITFCHQKGGVGKSTLAFNIAVELSKKHKVVVIDLDQQQSLSSYNKVRKLLNTKPLKLCGTLNDRVLMEFIDKYEDDNRIIIIDTGGFDSEVNRLAISISDHFFTPTSLDFTDILGFQYFENMLKEMSIKDHLVANIIRNKIDPNQKNFTEFKKFIDESSHFQLMNTIIRRRVDYANSSTRVIRQRVK